MMLVAPGDEFGRIFYSNSAQTLQHDQNLSSSRYSCIDVESSHTWQMKSSQNGAPKQLPAVNRHSRGASPATVHRIKPMVLHTKPLPPQAAPAQLEKPQTVVVPFPLDHDCQV